MSEPSFGINVRNLTVFPCKFRVKADGKETSQSGIVQHRLLTSWSYDELVGQGFKEGDTCWVSLSTDGSDGAPEHESDTKFILSTSTTQTL